jgi:hypothetical protein
MKKNKAFSNIMAGLNEVLDWTKGKTKVRVTMPGKKARMMTKSEYDQETQSKI